MKIMKWYLGLSIPESIDWKKRYTLSMPNLIALCARLAGNELVAAECENLTGGRPSPDGFEPNSNGLALASLG